MRALPARCLLVLTAIAGCGLPVPLTAAPGMPQIRHSLYLDRNADVEADLRRLAEKGDRDARLLLADVLSASTEAASKQEALALYRAIFESGNGDDVTPLPSLARLVTKNPHQRREHEDFFRQALQQFSPTTSFAATSAALEIFLAYPDLLDVAQIAQLIQLYERACISACHDLVYHARLSEKLGDRASADASYRRAIRNDVRAVDLYFNFLGDDNRAEFIVFAATLKADIAILPLDVVQSVAALLVTTAEKADPDIVFWLDHAISRGSRPAMVSKAEYMMASPSNYSHEDTQVLIDQIAIDAPVEGRMLRASFYMVRSWRVLNPVKSLSILQELIQEGHERAYMGLGELYSMGGLDEADQPRALQAYEQLARQGFGPAFYRIANIHAAGRSICHDKPKAYAYAMVALELGELQAQKLLDDLEAEIGPDITVVARQMRDSILQSLETGS